MNKFFAIIMTLAILMSFAACGQKNDISMETTESESSPAVQIPDNPKESTAEAETAGLAEPVEDTPGFLFHYKDIEIAMSADASPILKALGEPKSYTEETSCAFSGLDKTYFYGSFYMQTYPDDNKEYVYCLWFADDSVATEEGITIGSTQEDVEKAYGKDSFNGKNAYIKEHGNTELTIILKDGVVESVQYLAIGV